MRKKFINDRNLYFIWHSMIDRCENPKNRAYYRYGAVGRNVCDEWKDYKAFEEWSFKNGFQHGLSLDRINNDKGYSPDNCRWTDALTQANNKNTNRVITIDGESHNLIEWIRIKGLCKRTVYARLDKGMSEIEALTIPINSKYQYWLGRKRKL